MKSLLKASFLFLTVALQPPVANAFVSPSSTISVAAGVREHTEKSLAASLVQEEAGELTTSCEIDVTLPSATTAAATTTTPASLRKRQVVATLLGLALTGAAAASFPSLSPFRKRNILAGAAIFSVGDVCAQLLTMKRSSSSQQFDKQRLAISVILGALWSGLCTPAIYGFSERVLSGRSLTNVLGKMVVTCSILSTIGNYATMYIRRFGKRACTFVVGDLERFAVLQELKSCGKSCNAEIFQVIKDDLKIWPLHDIMCFALIPPSIRPITTAIMSSAWSMYMSLVSAKEESQSKED